jgi:cell division protein FtsA
MAVTDFIVAIELGSAKISGIAGKKLPDGSIQILATASENASDCIRKGVIYNLDKTTQSLTSIIKKLESTLKASIGKVYIGMGGQSLRTIRNTEVRHMDEEIKISQELIDSLKDSNRSVPIVGYQILGVAPQEYKVGNDLIVEPVGVQTDHIEARFLNIIARKNVKDNVNKCCDLVPIEVAEDAEDLIAPLALADAVLTSGEKRSGCVLVDFGADTTTVSVYKNNILRHLAVIPLGGNNITRDICSQQIEEEDAEALKIKFAQAYSEPKENEDENKTYNLEGKCSINAILLEDIVEARVNEILDNVAHQIALSGYDNKLLAGAVITGGGINLRNMEEAFIKRTKMEKLRVAKDTHISLKGLEVKKDGSNNTLIALLAAGKENCCLAIPTPEQPKPEPVKKASVTTNVIEGQLFTETGESLAAAKEEEERKRQLEKEAIIAQQKAEKEAQRAAAEAQKAAEEAERKRKVECEELIQDAIRLKNNGEYNSAKKKLEKASKMRIAEKEEAISTLEKEVLKLKSENSFWGNISKKVNEVVGKVLDEE